jgi:hypothetical protein
MFNDPHGCADCGDKFIRVVKWTDKMHSVPVGAIVRSALLVPENNAALDRINSLWLVNSHVDIDIKSTVYSSYHA